MQRKASVAGVAAVVVALGALYVWRLARKREAALTTQSAGSVSGHNADGSVEVVPAAGLAGVEGEAVLTAVWRAPGKLHRQADPYCARTEMTDPTVLVADGKLANVWVHVVKGAPDALPPAAPIEIDQRDCMYVPRVAIAVVGQKIAVRNGDPVLHNVHAFLGDSTLFNRGMPNDKAAPLEYTPVQPGLLRLKCDVHPWMRGYVGVSATAFQAVTGPDGAFRLPDLPAGRYTLEAWHEKLGALTAEVGAPARIRFVYEGAER
jgi:plastocyanin